MLIRFLRRKKRAARHKALLERDAALQALRLQRQKTAHQAGFVSVPHHHAPPQPHKTKTAPNVARPATPVKKSVTLAVHKQLAISTPPHALRVTATPLAVNTVSSAGSPAPLRPRTQSYNLPRRLY